MPEEERIQKNRVLLFPRKRVDVFHAAGILVTGVLGISVIISYEQKLKAFLADLTAEEASSLDASASSGSLLSGSHKNEW